MRYNYRHILVETHQQSSRAFKSILAILFTLTTLVLLAVIYGPSSFVGALISEKLNLAAIRQYLSDPVHMRNIFIAIIPLTATIVGSIYFLKKIAKQFLDDQRALRTEIPIPQPDQPAAVPVVTGLGAYTNLLEAEITARMKALQNKIDELNRSNELLKKREEELTLSNERLRELDTAKSEFLSVAAHQLRTPLAAIKWTLSLLIDENAENLTPEQKTLLMKGYESNERILGIVNEMLVVTRIESGKTTVKLAPLRLEDVTDSVLLDFSGQAHVRHIHLSRDKSSTPSPLISADPDMMRSVIQNLIENAMRYTPDGGTVLASVTYSPNEVKMTIKDSGIGIPPEQQSSIFNKFFRADNAAKFRPNGSGLGLYVVKNFIEKHGGKIWFDSAVGSGTTFTFTLPASPIVPPAV